MNAKQQAFSDLQRLGQMLKGVIDVATELDKVGSVEQAGDEAQARLDDLKAQGDQESVLLEKAREKYAANCDALKAEADRYSAAKKAEADNLVVGANNKASDIVAAANDKASGILDNAGALAAQRIKDIEGSKAELDDLHAKIAQAGTDLDEANSKVTKANEALASVKASHQAFIASIGVQ